MAGYESSAELRFEPPGPGPWIQDAVHFPRPVTHYFQETHCEGFARGTSDFARFYGMVIDGLVMSYVNGFGYRQIRPAPEAEIPARFARAEEVFAKKLWREQLQTWDEVAKPAAVAAHRALQAVDVDSLSDGELSAYLQRCRDHHAAMLAQHMRFTAGAMIPTGDFLAHALQWTGLPPADLLALLRGAAPVSAGGSDELQRLRAAFAQDANARALLNSSGDPAQVLAQLRALPGEAGAAIGGYLDLVGNRLLDGFDIAEPTAIELPDQLLRAIQLAAEGEPPGDANVEAATAAVREKVPPEHRDEFDALLAEARLTYRLRDERGVYSDIWASGIMRRAALGAGRRMAARGRIAAPEHFVEASIGEMQGIIAGAAQPTADELATRAAYRAAHSAREAPPALGPEEPPPPDLSGLPPGVGRVMAATFISLGQLFGSSEAQHEDDKLFGLAASGGVYEGPARRVNSPSEFGRILKGDVLVTEATTEAFNILLPLLGAIVTDNGGLLSHSAIVAREYGIPGVVGTREATERIADGQRVRVDGDAGEVTVLA